MAFIELNFELIPRRAAFNAAMRRAIAAGMEEALDDPIKTAAVEGSPERRGTN